jgi:hypothetical protein
MQQAPLMLGAVLLLCADVIAGGHVWRKHGTGAVGGGMEGFFGM